MGKPITHVVHTRFAVRIPGKLEGNPAQKDALTPAWVASRFELFERYLLPSMRAQTFTDWSWRIYVHEGFDLASVDRFHAYDPRIRVVTSPVTPVEGPSDGGILASTRIDSDDGFASHAMETVNRYALKFAARTEPAQLLRLKQGWWAHHQRERAYQCRGWSFLTVFERNGPYQGPFKYSCDDIARFYPEWTEQGDMWLRVVHGANITNKFNPNLRTVPLETLRTKGFAWMAPATVAPDAEPEPVAGPLPRVAIVMRTTDRRRVPMTRDRQWRGGQPARENYLKRTVGALVAQGVSGVRVQCSKVSDAAWVHEELGPIAEQVTILPTEVDLSPNATAIAGLASVDLDACDWVLLLEDDLKFCKDFLPSVQRWLQKHGRPDRHLFRFWGFHRPPSQAHRRAAFDHPLDRKMAASQAIAFRREDAAHFLAWATANLATWRQPGKADPGVAFDKLVASWALTHWPDQPGVLSWPFFVDHIGVQSSIHGRGGMNPVGFAGSRWSYEAAL